MHTKQRIEHAIPRDERYIAFAAVTALIVAAAIAASILFFRSPLHANPPQQEAPSGVPLAHRLVVVLADGLREDTSRDPQWMPFLQEVRSRGAWAVMHSQPPSYSAPGYTTIFTGAWPELNDGPVINVPYGWIPVWTQDHLFAVVRRAGGRTAAAAFNWYERMIPAEDLADSLFTKTADRAADELIMAAARGWLAAPEHELVFIHLNQIDHAGHYEGGPGSAGWNAAAARVDTGIREIAGMLDLERDALLILSDHGHIDTGGHGGPEAAVVTEPFLLMGAGVRPGFFGDVAMTDAAPTAAVLLGVAPPASSQGRVLVEMLVSDASGRLVEAEAAQKRRLAASYLAAIGMDRLMPLEGKTGEVFLQAMERGKNLLLTAGRLLRLLVVAVLLGEILRRIRAVRFLFSWRDPAALGAYALAFHLVYGVLFQHTYSLSGFRSAGGALASITFGCAAGLAAAWLVYSLGRQAGQYISTLRGVSILLAAGLTLPPVIHYAWNGLLADRFLPEMTVAYLAVLSLLQIFFLLMIVCLAMRVISFARHPA